MSESVYNSEFARRTAIINGLLEVEELGFLPEEAAPEDHEQRDIDRQMHVLTMRWNELSIEELEALSPEVTAGVEAQQIRECLGKISRDLTAWFRGQDIDSISAQRIRADIYQESSSALSRLVAEMHLFRVVDFYRLSLTIGEGGVDGYSFNKGAYDMYSSSLKALEPGRVVNVRTTSSWTSDMYRYLDGKTPLEFYPAKEIFIGDYSCQLPCAVVARVLSEGGNLRLEKIDELEQVQTIGQQLH